ncbi:Hpt domain-containing protein [Zobellella maritima]|uniref:Hpt domain-containing protein n=1 Tax=Zobellella maritima TaxID=2059725 RepID=UPI000E30B242|nr:Hpt domain-containing protein [Zobellella maritima]
MTDWHNLQSRLPLLDRSRLAHLRQDLGVEVVKGLLTLFIEDIRQQRQEVAQAFADRDYVRLSHSCHSLKSVCGSYGVLRCQFLSEKLEAAGRREDSERVSAMTPVLLQGLEALLEEMANEVGGG